MQISRHIYSKLSRITTSGTYIPEIDGLRFLAIALVALYHIHGYLVVNSVIQYSDLPADYGWLHEIFRKGHIGVQLFFTISGMILAMPFASHYINGGREVNIRSYFVRRLTRLEPPYILVLVAMFSVQVLFLHHHSPYELTKSFFASLFYVNNLVFPGQLPLINCVTWSLEIEIQFYILAPLLARIFTLGAASRRCILAALILIFPLLQYFYPASVNTLYNHIQYFLAGFLIADLYISKTEIRLPGFLSVLLGLGCLGVICTMDDKALLPSLVIPGCMVIFYLLVLTTGWKKLFRLQFFSITGGMCYSIYLIHFALVAFLGKLLIKFQFSSYFLPDFFIKMTILTITVLVVSSVFFVMVEKVCMQKDWYRQLGLRMGWKPAGSAV